jgi:hypothetical protein
MFSIFVAAAIVMKHLAILALIAMIGSPGAAYAAEPVELATFRALARPAPTVVLQYGTAASQAVELLERDDRRSPTTAAHRGGTGNPGHRGVEHWVSARQ